MSTEPPEPVSGTEAISRLERMVGEIIGMRLLIGQLLNDIGAVKGDTAAYLAETRTATLATLDGWTVHSDTPEGAARIKSYAHSMLSGFPGPTKTDTPH